MSSANSAAIAAAKKIKLLLLDVDGVLTDGHLYYGNNGEELKAFDIQDGLGIKLLQRAGCQVGIITGRVSKLLQRRADELGISPVVQGREDKLTALVELLETMDIQMDEIAFMGDDLPDLAVINRVGLGHDRSQWQCYSRRQCSLANEPLRWQWRGSRSRRDDSRRAR